MEGPLQNSPSFVLGVDGGTTKTIALLADHCGKILSAARGPGSNWSGEDVEIPMGVVSDTVRRVLHDAHLSGSQVAAGVFCLAGADWPEDHTRRQAVLEKACLAQRVVVKNDSFGGLRAGATRPYGIVLAAGTGMNAAVITPDGQEWAYGYYETYGGAKSVADEAFVAVLRAEDGRGKPTLLTSLALQKLGFPSVEQMLRASIARRIDRSRFMTLCPLVFAAASQGDEVAAEILVKQGQALAEYATAIFRRFHLQALEIEVVLAGSLFKGEGPILVDTITQAIHRVAPEARVVKARFEPAVGCVLLAYDHLGWKVTPEMLDQLAGSAPGEELFSTVDGGRRLQDRPVENSSVEE